MQPLAEIVLFRAQAVLAMKGVSKSAFADAGSSRDLTNTDAFAGVGTEEFGCTIDNLPRGAHRLALDGDWSKRYS